MTTRTDNRVDVDGLELHYVETGPPDSPAVLILHGVMGHSREWNLLAETLAPHFRVVSLDQRGHGHSDRANDYSVSALADDVIGVIERLSLAPAHVVGHSMGAMASLVAASRRSHLMDRMVVIDIGPESVTPETGAMLAEWIRGLGARRYADVDEAMAEWMGDVFAQETLMRNYVENNLVQTDGGLAWMFDPDIARFPLEGVSRDELWKVVDTVRSPTLLLRGRHSEHFPRDAAREVAERLADGRLVEIPDGAHDLGVENQQAVADEILRFLSTGPSSI